MSGCSFGVEHGNASFREFTSKIDVNPERQGLYAINEIFAKIMKCTTFEDVLQDNTLFFRSHKSHIVNLKFIKQYIRGDGGELIMLDGKNIPLSRTKKQDFLDLFTRV